MLRILLVDVVEDEQLGCVVRPCKLSYNVLHYCVDVDASIYCVLPACL